MSKRSLDLIHLLLAGLTIVGWGVLFYALVVFHQARPEMSTIITLHHEIAVRTTWLLRVYERLMFLLWFCAGVSFASIVVNWYLRIQQQDTYWFPALLLGAVSSVGALVLTIWRPLMNS
ncbi:hypothetical protein [Psychrobium sp. 1_MG-2023]|uniref:hypothetical protein n=1 Tax=Psychrobium sp. 1_MG-2023 TaxID=3062624 RepID=UPI000C31B910|nr:hypothetical protein [Psychrobium sp. 1_MG-2023]MDP2561526.1 hypothetical protein [Psychrobium sp. 1_MG-2023]PKF54989.1 hypothetical protein CW748_14515 [Alteromonadales bacterium alter-6D02]